MALVKTNEVFYTEVTLRDGTEKESGEFSTYALASEHLERQADEVDFKYGSVCSRLIKVEA